MFSIAQMFSLISICLLLWNRPLAMLVVIVAADCVDICELNWK